jgi:outer membrane receptor for ferrienterochelin and colicin
MKSVVRSTLVLLALILVSATGFAQTTAALSGTATSDGAALAGVTVTISSPSLQGVRTTVTGENGGYYFGALPPGRYTVKFELEGLQTVTKLVDVGVAQTGRADAALRVAAVSEALVVTASAPTVLETPEVATNISGDLVEELPIGRTILAAALLAPGVNDNTLSANQLSISGSPGYDNLVMVNGVVITENVRSQALQLYIEDAIQETTVLTGAVSAEYGRFTGGVVNSITKSGGNEFSGSFRDSFTNPSWTDTTPFEDVNNLTRTDVTNEIYEATLGGRIIRDRLWFFLAGRQAETSTPIQGRPLPGEPAGNVYNVVTGTENEKYEIKLTGAINAQHSLVGSFYDEAQDSTNTRFTAVSYDLDSLTDRSDPKQLISGFYNGILTQNFLVEARYSEMEYGIGHGSGSKFTDVIRGTIVRNLADSSARYNSPTFCGVCDKEWRNNDSWTAKGNYFLSTSGLGNHNLVAGYETFSEQRYSNNFQSGSNFRLFVNSVQRVNGELYPTLTSGAASPNAYIIWTPIFDAAEFNDLQTDSVFVNDKWDLNEYLTFNLGARFDMNDAVDGNGNAVSDDSHISPRLTAIYDVKGNGQHRFTASYNEYVSRIVEGPGTAAQSVGTPGYIQYSYLGPEINPVGTPVNELVSTHDALQIVFDWFFAQGGTDNLSLLRPGGSRDVPGYTSRILDQLESPFVQEITLGYGMQIGANAFVKIDGIARDWKNFYAYRVDQNTPQEVDFLNINHDLSVVENTNDITREYRGVQLQSGWRPNRFNVGVNYTYSTLKGNDEQESATSGTVGNSPGHMYYSEFLGYDRRQPEGYLSGDLRHRARAWVGYDLPLGMFGSLNASLLHNFDSGMPYSAVGTIRTTGAGTGAPAPGRYVSAPSTGQYYFSDRGEFRLDDVHRTDFALNYNLPIKRVGLFIQGEVLNLFNNDTLAIASGPGAINTSILTANNSTCLQTGDTNPNVGKRCATFNPFTETPVEGIHWRRGASFGKATSDASHQLPLTYRFSAGIRF